MPNPALLHLQRQLRERFPMARHGLVPSQHAAAPEFDLHNPASFPVGGITEIIPASPASGLSLFLAALLEDAPENRSIPELALIDGRDSFDPFSFSSQNCAKLLWIRCQTPEQSIKAADLILRDGNLPRVILDLLAFPVPELRRIPNSTWHRLKQSIEANHCSFIGLTSQALIPCARLRLSMNSQFHLDHLAQSRGEAIQQLQVASILQRKWA